MWSYARFLLWKSKVGRHLQRLTEEPKQSLWAEICSEAQVLAQGEHNAFMQKPPKLWKIRYFQWSCSQSKPFCKSVWNRETTWYANEDWKQFSLSAIIFHLKYLLSPAIFRHPQTNICEVQVMGATKGVEGAWFLSVRSILVATQARLQEIHFFCTCMSITGDPYHSYMKETRKGVASLMKCRDIQGFRIGALAICL